MRVSLLVVALLGLLGDRPAAAQGEEVTYPAYPRIVGSGAPRPGEWIRFDIESIRDKGAAYRAASSLGTGPIPFGGGKIPLDFDAVFFLSLGGLLPRVFENYQGALDAAAGRARLRLHIPRVRELVGVRVHTAFVTLSTGLVPAVLSISPAYTFTITR